MPAPTTVEELIAVIGKSGLLEPAALSPYVGPGASARTPLAGPRALADALVQDGLLTRFQAEQLLLGRWRNFILSGKYKVLDCLGTGGMGSVFLCEHLVMRRRVALKVLPAGRADDPDALERFRREARAIACLSHPNIVTAHDTDHDGNLHFLVMEYIDGSSLDRVVRARGPLDPERAAHYIRQAALGLQHAHEAGIVHRDVKPSNLLLDRSGTVKVLDLGLARFFRDGGDDLTRSQVPLGTTDYMAPEQALDSRAVDARADVYSLGVTFYYLLTGRSPFKGAAIGRREDLQARQTRPIREARPDLPEGLAAIIDRMLARAPADRFQSAADVGAALLPWVQRPVAPPSAEDLARPVPGAQHAAETAEELGALTPLSGVATAPLPLTMTGGRDSVTPRSVPPSAQAAADRTLPPRASRRRLLVGAGVVGLLLAGGLLAYLAAARWGNGPPAPPVVENTDELRLLVPAYFYPGGDQMRQWDRLIDSAGLAPVVAIANPASGPGKAADPNFVEVIDRCRKAGITVIGYVSTAHGARRLPEVTADVDRWAHFYPRIQGIFFDEQASGAAQVDYYTALCDHARKALPGALVVTNPGTLCAEEYLSRPAADVACLAESGKDFSVYRPPSWADRYPARRFAALVDTIETPEQMKELLRQMKNKRVGYGYVTNGTGVNPWNRLPPYWDAEVAAAQHLNRRQAP